MGDLQQAFSASMLAWPVWLTAGYLGLVMLYPIPAALRDGPVVPWQEESFAAALLRD
jgi:hypothetical protein